MNVVERGTFSLKRTSKSWNIPMIFVADRLNGKTRSRKMGLRGVLTEKEDVVMIKWTLNMQEFRLSISVQ